MSWHIRYPAGAETHRPKLRTPNEAQMEGLPDTVLGTSGELNANVQDGGVIRGRTNHVKIQPCWNDSRTKSAAFQEHDLWRNTYGEHGELDFSA